MYWANSHGLLNAASVAGTSTFSISLLYAMESPTPSFTLISSPSNRVVELVNGSLSLDTNA